MKKPLVLLTLALLVASLLLVGCGRRPYDPPTPIPTLPPATLPHDALTEAVTEATDETATEAAPTQAEAAAPTAASEDTPVGVAGLEEKGGEVFDQTCSVCHNLTTETLVGPGLTGLFEKDSLPNGQPVTEENLKEWIVSGGGAMPGLPLTQDQLEAVVAFLKDATQP
jgi:mono/diheme cytochrome c family protein